MGMWERRTEGTTHAANTSHEHEHEHEYLMFDGRAVERNSMSLHIVHSLVT